MTLDLFTDFPALTTLKVTAQKVMPTICIYFCCFAYYVKFDETSNDLISIILEYVIAQ